MTSKYVPGADITAQTIIEALYEFVDVALSDPDAKFDASDLAKAARASHDLFNAVRDFVVTTSGSTPGFEIKDFARKYDIGVRQRFEGRPVGAPTFAATQRKIEILAAYAATKQ